jgi:hypothetical protein
MQVSLDEAKERYGIRHVWTKANSMSEIDLCSGGERDPSTHAEIDASQLAVDENGASLPYDVNISIFLIPLGEGESVFEMKRSELWKRQKIQTQVLVFNDFQCYQKYKKDGINVVFQPNE